MSDSDSDVPALWNYSVPTAAPAAKPLPEDDIVFVEDQPSPSCGAVTRTGNGRINRKRNAKEIEVHNSTSIGFLPHFSEVYNLYISLLRSSLLLSQLEKFLAADSDDDDADDDVKDVTESTKGKGRGKGKKEKDFLEVRHSEVSQVTQVAQPRQIERPSHSSIRFADGVMNSTLFRRNSASAQL